MPPRQAGGQPASSIYPRVSGGNLAESTAGPPRSRTQKAVRVSYALRLLADGRTMKEVGAAALGVSARTVETHKYQTMEALGLKSTAEPIRYAIEHGLATPPSRG